MNRFFKMIAWLIIIAPAVYLFIIWDKLPDTIALHYNVKGEADRYGNKSELITMTAVLSLVNTVIYLLLPQVYKIDPKKHAAENKDRLQRIAFAVCAFTAAIICLLIYSSAHGNMEFGTRFILAAIGLLFAVMGNYMHTIKPNYFAGFRLPWTLQDDDNWKKTHLLGGKLFFAGGLFIAVVSLFAPFLFTWITMVVTTLIIILITAIYSYRLYKSRKDLNSGNV